MKNNTTQKEGVSISGRQKNFNNLNAQPPETSGEQEYPKGAPRSLRELIDRVSGRHFHTQFSPEDAGLAEVLPFPYLAIVGQSDMKLALLITLINPIVGGVLLIGPRGTGKTTAVRSLVDLLPDVPRSLCYYGCMPEDVEAGGIDAICPDCARKYAAEEPLAKLDRVRMVELPLNALLEDVVGGLDERAAIHDRMRIRRGILAQADQNILYADEVNLLRDEVVDAILDAAAQGKYTVRRGPVSASYRARFTLIGSMNPEEGNLRPQIMDRFGLRVFVRGLTQDKDRLEAYRRVHSYLLNPRKTIAQFAGETELLREEIQITRSTLEKVTLPDEVAQRGLKIIQHLGIDSLRAEITLFEASRAYAAADGRESVDASDLDAIAPLALSARRSAFMVEFLNNQKSEEEEIQDILTKVKL